MFPPKRLYFDISPPDWVDAQNDDGLDAFRFIIELNYDPFEQGTTSNYEILVHATTIGEPH